MGFNIERGKDIPKGRVIPMYLTDDGDLFPILFTGEDQMDIVATMVGIAMDHKIVIDSKNPINDPKYKLSIYDMKKKKIL